MMILLILGFHSGSVLLILLLDICSVWKLAVFTTFWRNMAEKVEWMLLIKFLFCISVGLDWLQIHHQAV
jgi:hypothetical protein